MRYLPNRAIDILMSKKLKCHSCQKLFKRKDVISVGIKSSITDRTTDVFYMELECIDCKKATFFEMQPMTLVELSEEIFMEREENEIIEDEQFLVEDFEEKEMSLLDLEDFSNETEEYYESNPFREKPKPKSKITVEEIRCFSEQIKNMKHNKFLEMLGVSPEEIYINKKENNENN